MMRSVENDEDGAPSKSQLTIEVFRRANIGLNKSDFDTIALQINNHGFTMCFDDFLRVISVMAENAQRFAAIRARGPMGSNDNKAVN